MCLVSAAPFPPAADDYAHKKWSGLLRDFYLQRWQMFAQELSAQLDGKPAEEPHYFEFEKGWTEQRNTYPAEPTDDPVSTAATMLFRFCLALSFQRFWDAQSRKACEVPILGRQTSTVLNCERSQMRV